MNLYSERIEIIFLIIINIDLIQSMVGTSLFILVANSY